MKSILKMGKIFFVDYSQTNLNRAVYLLETIAKLNRRAPTINHLFVVVSRLSMIVGSYNSYDRTSKTWDTVIINYSLKLYSVDWEENKFLTLKHSITKKVLKTNV